MNYLRTTNQEMHSMVCRCGWSFRPIGALFGSQPVFDSYYDPVLKKHLTSYREQEREGRKFRSKDHPEGLMPLNDNKKFVREMKYVAKHKIEYKMANNPGYKPGHKGSWDPDRPDKHTVGKKCYFI